ncbi:hypothetical protein JCM17845_16400 [Iodidimonas gelatinilytica]|uniref:Helicase C-terminal domain-containing protein n=1 Tax=Iodidimonas gelatinilytica TaxID=1236966 RepID=A0A5A7MZ02_9PROT|nr:helicase-related protein [Iodidimonas gelatinilytica]GER01017.1 hypothetical protein JCM17845_16400 [Iodidimonas gelatinilytica]
MQRAQGDGGRVIAVLGPTNTGKTHYAVERMLGHASGMIGFPLRLLAREIYDRVVAAKGAARVALLTGEEKIVPPRPSYWICTVESMPMSQRVDFLAVDEIQLAADAQRGHVFTDRLLYARGVEETVFMGAATMQPLISRLLPDATLVTRQRLSQLRYVQPQKLHRLPRRAALVAFSAENVYGLAELVRRNRGGTAVVMGALSPRTRNAQVALYQNGDVDYLVATDAIGMGLNMDIDHVAFSATHKFDGERVRALSAPEVAQIAGRAGRHMNDGSFSTLAGAEGASLDPQLIAQVEDHDFRPLKALIWRNSRLDYRSAAKLVASLESPSARPDLVRAREALDLQALKALAKNSDVSAIATTPAAVQRLWEVCQIPDFRRVSASEHLSLLQRIYRDLMGRHGVVPHDWMAKQVSRLDNVQGDIDTLAARIANIRTWTYVANRRNWLSDAAHWAHVTRGIEDKLSDALHDRLTQRFVDRRTSVLMRELRQRGELSVSIDETNEIIVEGHAIGTLDGFTFRADPSAVGEEFKTLEQAADIALKAEITRRAKIFCNIGYKTLQLDVSEGMHRPKLVWQKSVIARLEKGDSPYEPRVKLVEGTLLTDALAENVRQSCAAWLSERIADKLEPLLKLKAEIEKQAPAKTTELQKAPESAEEAPQAAADSASAPDAGEGAGDAKAPAAPVVAAADAPLAGLARGVAFQILERFGVLPRGQVSEELRKIDQDARKGLRRFHIRIGATALYIPLILKPHAVELRLLAWALWNGISDLPPMPTPGLVWIQTDPKAPREFYEIAGFRLIGGHEAVRLDMLERLADTARPLGQNGAKFTVTPEIMGLVGCSGESFIRSMRAVGYAHEIVKVPAPVQEVPVQEAPAKDTSAQETPVQDAADAASDVAPETAPETVPEATPDATAEAAPEAAADVFEPEMVDEARFFWSPRQPRPASRNRNRSHAANHADQRKGGGPKVKNAHRAKTEENRPEGGRSHGNKSGGKGRAAGHRQGDGRGYKSHASADRKPRDEINEDSPFAQLKALKDALEKRG